METVEEPESEEKPADLAVPDQPAESDGLPETEEEAASQQSVESPDEADLPAESAEEPEIVEATAEITAPDQPLETDELPEAEEEAVSQQSVESPDEADLPAESAEEPEIVVATAEITAPDQPAETDGLPQDEDGEITAEIDNFLEETEPPADVPSPAQEEVTQLKADGISLDSEKLPGQRSLEDSVDDGVADSTFGDIELPALSDAPAGAATDKPDAGEDDEEIFLPDELLFLDEDEPAPAEAVAGDTVETEDSETSTDLEELPVPADPEPEEPAVIDEPEAEEEIAAPAIPDLSEIDAEDIQLPGEETAEPEELAADEIPPEQDEPEVDGEQTGEVAESETETAATDDEQIDSEALFSDDDLDDEDEQEQETTPAADPASEGEMDEEALAVIEKFRETSDQSESTEPDLELDSNPLGEAQDEEDLQELEAVSPEDDPAAAEEATESIEPELEAEAEPEPELETEAATEDIDVDQEAVTEEPEEAIPVEEDLIDITEGDAPIETEAAGEGEEVVEAVAETGDEVEAEAIEEVAELDDDELEELETGDLESLDDEINTTAGVEGEDAPEAAQQETGPEDSAQTAETEELDEISGEAETPEAVEEEVEDEDVPDVPDDEELDELLSGTDDIDDIAGGITLDQLDEIDDVQPEAAGKGGKKSKKKAGSKSKSMVMLIMLLVVGFGLFFIWRGGYVSELARQMPALSGLAGLISNTDEEDQQREQALRKAAADSAAVADSLSRIPLPPKFDKLGYSIQIGSYRYLTQAMAARDRLLENGLEDVFVVPLLLDSLGNWNRLYMGMYRSSGKGDTALLNLASALRLSGITDGINGGAITRHTPLTLMVAEASDPDSLQSVIEKLETNHIPAYMVQLLEQDSTSMPLYRLYSGAFENESQAVFLREQIFNIGVRATVVEREGQAEQTVELQAEVAPAPPV